MDSVHTIILRDYNSERLAHQLREDSFIHLCSSGYGAGAIGCVWDRMGHATGNSGPDGLGLRWRSTMSDLVQS